jgi:molybdopterin-guanine dinucleotide biosynthesis protein A/molybdopterin converting factor small subunit
MGQPKSLLLFDDEPLILHVVRALATRFPEVIVVAAPEQTLPAMPVTLVRDEVSYQGPVGGISYGLAAAAGEMCFVTSCDSVFLNLDLIAHLLSRAGGYDVVVPDWQGRLQPLHAVYRRGVLPHLQSQLAQGDLRPIHLFDKVPTLRIGEPEIRELDPGGWSFFNMNTPEDYTAALARWRELHAGPAGGPGDAVLCTMELFGLPQMLAGTREVQLTLAAGATLADAFAGLAARVPALAGRVIRSDRRGLVDGYACNVNGVEFVRDASVRIRSGDSIILLAADAGG